MEEADARFDECLEVILKAWTADEPFSHRGKYWQFDNIVVEPPTGTEVPTRRSGWARAASARSAGLPRKASTCCSANTPRPRTWPANIAVYRSEVEARGRRFDPMQVGVTRAFFVAENERSARRRWSAAWPTGCGS